MPESMQQVRAEAAMGVRSPLTPGPDPANGLVQGKSTPSTLGPAGEWKSPGEFPASAARTARAPGSPAPLGTQTPPCGHPSSYACCCQPGVSQRDPFGIFGGRTAQAGRASHRTRRCLCSSPSCPRDKIKGGHQQIPANKRGCDGEGSGGGLQQGDGRWGRKSCC